MSEQELMRLAERCEAATGADRELDADIHAATIGPQINAALGFGRSVKAWPDGKGGGRSHPFRFTSSVDEAENALPDDGGWPEWQVTRRHGTGYHANVGLGSDSVGCETAALALCAAALRARAQGAA